MNYLLRFLLYTVMLLCPLYADADNNLLDSYTMRVGETKTLYISNSMQNILNNSMNHWISTTWKSSNSSAVRITSQGKTSCTVQALTEVSGSVKIEYDIEWGDYYLNWGHTKDYYNIWVAPKEKLWITASTSGEKLIPGESIKVTLSASVDGASIYYTLDGSTPTTSSTLYTSAGITINSACTLHAIAVKSGYTTSDVFSATFSMTESLTAKTTEGIDMKFKIIDETAKTCEVTSNCIDNNTSGKITIPSSVNGFKVTRIGKNAFSQCANLTTVVIPSTVEEIGNNAFSDCSNITSVSLPSSLKSIGRDAFSVCKKIVSIEIPNSVTTIDNQAFYQCSGLTSVVIGNSVTSIGDWAFYGCLGLTSVVIGNSVTSIGNRAFLDCSSLTSLTIPENVTSIGFWAFHGSELKSLKILSTEIDCGSSAFPSEKLEELTVNIKRLPSSMFYSFNGQNKFPSLKIFTFPKNLEYIDSSLSSLNSSPWAKNLPDGLNYIGKVLFQYKGKLPTNTKIKVVEGCTQIFDKAFSGNEGLIEISIPSSVVAIGTNALGSCKNLKTITVNDGNPAYDSRGNCNAIIEKLTNKLIAGCSGTTIPSTVTTIGGSAFNGTIDWEEIIIPNQIDSIGPNAFSNNNNVRSILIGKGLRKIYTTFAFSSLPNLKEIAVSASNPYFDSRDNCNAIIEKATNTLVFGCSSTIIPNTVKVIGRYAFRGTATEMTSLVIPNSVEVINAAFDNMPNLQEVSIGANVKSFEKNSFTGCKNIVSIESLNGFPDDIPDDVFSNSEVYTNATLYVPDGCRNNYRLASGWNQFKNIVEGQMPSGIVQVTMDSMSENEVVHSLSGQRISAPQKGLNIINGKKYVVK